MFTLAQMPAPQLPPLPEGPALENIRGPIEASGFSSAQVVLAALAGALIGGAMIWLFMRLKKTQVVTPDPKNAALAELEAASSAKDSERYAMLCANAVRRLLEASYALPATCQTSREIAKRLPLQTEQVERIEQFLIRCDSVKFAGQELNDAKRIELSDTAKEIIEQIRPKEETT